MTDQDDHYDDNTAAFFDAIWGEGYMSPGGPEEVARVLDGLDLKGKTILDIGCGTGAITLSLARDHGAGKVIGIDVEEGVVATATARMTAAGMGDRVSIQQVTPGPFPFADESFDIVFSKDSIIHIENKEALAAESFRVLRSGGYFAASDWLISHDGPPSPAMAAYIEAEDLGFAMASPMRYHKALEGAGFVDVQTVNRNPWYREQARAELALIDGPRRAEFEADYGADFIAGQINTWKVMIDVVDSGEHCPHHLRGRKP